MLTIINPFRGSATRAAAIDAAVKIAVVGLSGAPAEPAICPFAGRGYETVAGVVLTRLGPTE
jgi:hypothetical protein